MQLTMSSFLLYITSFICINAQGTLKLHLLPKGETGGQCLDGSPAGFYYAPPPSGSNNLWVIKIKGGGACADKQSCLQRANTSLGSSKYWEPIMTPSGLLSDSPKNNPDFYAAHKVYGPYCSGDTWSGQRTVPATVPDTWGLYFSGHLIFTRIIQYLAQNMGIFDAEYVMLSGGSAGGIGTFGNINWLYDEFKQKGTYANNITVKAAPMAGWYFPGNTTDQLNDPMMPPNDYPHWLAHESGGAGHNNSSLVLWDSYLDPRCVTDLANNNNSWHCSSVHNLFPYIKVPVMVIENKFDKNQIVQGGLLPTTYVNANTTAYVEYYGIDMDRSMFGRINTSNHSNALFYASCFDHGGGIGLGSGNATVINGYTSIEIAGDWFWERNKLPHFVYDTCNNEQNKLPCNPTCDAYPPK